MTRIVAGTWGGRTLEVPARGTRPTSERVREAIFSRLTHLGIVGGGRGSVRVLDLYAGSGALALEAASRGASHITLVEAARPAAATARRNLANLGARGAVEQVAVDRYLTRAPDTPWDLVFCDPPYDIPEVELGAALAALARPGVLAPGATVVVERTRRAPAPRWPAGWDDVARRDYGETVVYYAVVPRAVAQLSAVRGDRDGTPVIRPRRRSEAVGGPGEPGLPDTS